MSRAKSRFLKFKSIFLIIIIFSIILINSEAADNKISIEVKSRMLEGSKVPVIIILKDQPSFLNFSKEKAIISLKSHASDNQKNLVSLLKEEKIKGKADKINQFWIVNAIAVNASPELIEKLATREDIASIELDSKFHIKEDYSTQVSSGQIDNATSEIKRINATKIWGFGIEGGGVNVSILDTGINSSHPDIAGRVIKWVDFVDNRSPPYDDDGHGTHVAGTVGGNGLGGITTGVAPNASLFGVKVLDRTGSGYESDIINGIQWSIDSNANIISMSLGTDQIWTTPYCDSDDPAMAIAINNSVNAGVVVVAAAGNSPGGVSSPGCMQKVIAAGAVDSSDTIASFSGRGSAMADHGVVAPGVSITSLNYLTTGYIVYSGTSMATPHISGAIALLLQAAEKNNTALSPAQVKNILDNTSVDLGDIGKDNTYGAGRIDVFEAIKRQVLASVRGKVIDNATKSGIAGAIITTNTGATTITNESGFYSLQLESGSYMLTVTSEPEYYSNTSVIVTLVPDSVITQDVELAKRPTGVLNGKVVNASSGYGIDGAVVKFAQYPQYNITTLGDGSYQINSVPIGVYTTVITKDGYAPNISSVTINQGNNVKNFSLTSAIIYYLPFLYQRADNIYDAGVQVQNNNSIQANMEIQFYYLNATSAGSGTFSVQPGELMTIHAFDITGTMPVYVGPAVVRSDIPVQVQGYIKTVNESVYSIAPSLTDTATSTYIPFLYQRSDNIYDAGVMAFNPGLVAANVTIKLYYLNGTVAGSSTYKVNPKSEVSKYIFDIVIGQSIFVGPAEITSDQPIVAQGFIRTKASMIYSIAPSVSTTVLRAYLPFLYQRSDNIYDAGVMVFNPGDAAANITINLYYLNGSLAGSGTYNIGPKAEVSKYVFDLVTGQAIFTGPAEIMSDQPITAQGFIRTKASMVYSIAPQVRKPVTASDAHIPFLYQTVNASHDAGIMAMNPNSVSANVGITLYYPNGTSAGSFEATVAPNAEISKYAFDIASGIMDFNGSAVVSADKPIVSQGFIRKKSTMIYSIAPPMER